MIVDRFINVLFPLNPYVIIFFIFVNPYDVVYMEIYQDWNPIMKFILNGIRILFSRVSSIIRVLDLNVETLDVWFIKSKGIFDGK